MKGDGFTAVALFISGGPAGGELVLHAAIELGRAARDTVGITRHLRVHRETRFPVLAVDAPGLALTRQLCLAPLIVSCRGGEAVSAARIFRDDNGPMLDRTSRCAERDGTEKQDPDEQV